MRTLSVINLKGGVAKTISSCNIAYTLSVIHNKRVLLVDNDKQGNASKLFNRYSYEHKTIAEVMTEKNINMEEVIVKTDYANLDLISANMNLLSANKDVLLDMSRVQQTRIKKALSTIKDKYDFCIIDNAPDINMSVINALVASDDVIVPIKIDKFAFDGLKELSEQIEQVREINPYIDFKGCFITMFQKNSVNLQGDEYLRTEGTYPIFKTIIRKSFKVDETTFECKPLLDYSKNCTASKDYISLVNEYMGMVNKNVSDSDTN